MTETSSKTGIVARVNHGMGFGNKMPEWGIVAFHDFSKLSCKGECVC